MSNICPTFLSLTPHAFLLVYQFGNECGEFGAGAVVAGVVAASAFVMMSVF